MPQKILWDEDEALILLDALLQVLSGALSRKNAAALVSRELRTRAIYEGHAIDDIFRNQNGIHLQMSIMECAFTGGKRGLKRHKVPKLFQDVVSLYENDRPSYEKRLAEAKAVIASANNQSHPVSKMPDAVLMLLQKANIKYVDHRKKGGCLWVIGDHALDPLIQQCREIGVIFRYKSDGARATDGLPAWWTKDSSKTSGAIIRGAGESVDGIFQIDFDCIEDMAHTSPRTLEYAGEKSEYRKWGRLYVTLISQLRANHENMFIGENGCNVSGSKTVMVASAELKTNFRRPRAIGGGLYVEGNCSATQIIKNIRYFLEICHVDFSSVVIRYTRNDYQAALEGMRNSPQPPNKLHSQFSAKLLFAAKAILTSNFVNGMRKNAAIAQKRFRRAYLDLTGDVFPESVNIDELAAAVGFEYAGKFYAVSENNQQTLQKLVLAAVRIGNRVMFYEELYRQHMDFMAEAGVFSADLLKAVLKQIFPDMCYKRTFFSPTDKDSLEQDIIDCFGDTPMRTCAELKERLLYANLSQIRLTCSRSDKFVWAKEETYALTDQIRLWQSDIECSMDTISRDIENQGFSVFQRISISESAGRNPHVPETAVREAMYIKHLAPHYEKTRSIITPPGISFNPSMVMVEYCKGLREATLSELQAYEEALTDRTRHFLSAACDTMIRVDREHFVSLDAIEFNIHGVDDALSLFVQDSIVPLGSVKSFTSFPEVNGHPWNLFLLDSFCRHKSMRFRTMGGPAKSKPVGAIFPFRMQFDSYDALLAQVAAKSGLALRPDTLGDFFTQNAYTLRRIETSGIINEAQEIRIQEGIADV